ncbi:MAG: hypothetical protein JSV68_21870 [Anaerolineaceae bacterium]|nr:MAG: hypothetical protein JSV68_21870 [Anaerolineaceae bacterium]
MVFTILALNLHSYQEMKIEGDSISERLQWHGPLFDRVAAAISDLNVDVVCLQEVAEASTDPPSNPYGQAPSNAARRINRRIADGQK